MQIALIIIAFVVMVFLMYRKILSPMFALPILAVIIGIIAGIPWASVTAEDGTVIPGMESILFVDGPLRLGSAIITFIFAGIFSQYVKNSGIAEALIHKVSELAGDRKLVLAIVLYAVLCLLFTSLGGLGSVIMIGTIVLPIMTSVGISSLTAGCILLFGLSVGGIFNLANWSLYIDSLGIPEETVRSFAYAAGIIFFLMGLLMILVDVKWGGKLFKREKKAVNWPVPEKKEEKKEEVHVAWYAMLSPFMPLILVLGFKMNINAGFVISLLYCFFTTLKKDSLQRLARAVTEGISNNAGALFMLIVIGILLKVVMDSRVTAIIGPAMAAILPSSGFGYVLFFGILAPLALYRGPLNIWGLGLGLATLMVSSGNLTAVQVMAALMTTGQLQGICDPTNTHNVWGAAETGNDVNDVLKKTLPYVWIGAVIGLIVAAIMYF